MRAAVPLGSSNQNQENLAYWMGVAKRAKEVFLEDIEPVNKVGGALRGKNDASLQDVLFATMWGMGGGAPGGPPAGAPAGMMRKEIYKRFVEGYPYNRYKEFGPNSLARQIGQEAFDYTQKAVTPETKVAVAKTLNTIPTYVLDEGTRVNDFFWFRGNDVASAPGSLGTFYTPSNYTQDALTSYHDLFDLPTRGEDLVETMIRIGNVDAPHGDYRNELSTGFTTAHELMHHVDYWARREAANPATKFLTPQGRKRLRAAYKDIGVKLPEHVTDDELLMANRFLDYNNVDIKESIATTLGNYFSPAYGRSYRGVIPDHDSSYVITDKMMRFGDQLVKEVNTKRLMEIMLEAQLQTQQGRKFPPEHIRRMYKFWERLSKSERDWMLDQGKAMKEEAELSKALKTFGEFGPNAD